MRSWFLDQPQTGFSPIDVMGDWLAWAGLLVLAVIVIPAVVEQIRDPSFRIATSQAWGIAAYSLSVASTIAVHLVLGKPISGPILSSLRARPRSGRSRRRVRPPA